MIIYVFLSMMNHILTTTTRGEPMIWSLWKKVGTIYVSSIIKREVVLTLILFCMINMGYDVTSERLFFDTYVSDVQNISVGSDHYCILYTDNTFDCIGATEQNSNNDSWCLEYADVDGDGYSVCDGDCDDSSIFLTLNDFDGDGFTTCDGDCNDVDETIGITDNDGDGYADCLDDCDANDILDSPNAIDYIGDGIDQDCDGADKNTNCQGLADICVV